MLFGLGRDAAIKSIEVTWSNGEVETFDGEAKAGQTVLLRKGTKRIETILVKRAQLPDPLTRAETFARGLKIAVGKPLPDVNIKTVDGKSATLKNQIKAGRQTLFNVWATWCVPCAQEMPELERLRPALAQKGIDLIGLNVDADPTADVRGFLKDNSVRYTILVGGVPLIETLYATDQLSVPLSVLVDERGIVTEIIPGWSNETRARFDRLAGIKDATPHKSIRATRKSIR